MIRAAAVRTAACLAGLVLLPLGLVTPAHAVCYTCPEIQAAARSVLIGPSALDGNVRDHVTDEHEELREGIERMTEQISRILLKQIETEEAMRSGEQKQRVLRERQKLELEAKQIFNRQPRTSCVSGTAMMTLPTGQVQRSNFRQQLTQASLAYDTNGTEATAGPEIAITSGRVAHRGRRYCSEVDAERGMCDSPVEERLQDADVNGATLLDQGTLDPEMNVAAQDFCHNLVRPVPPRPLNAAAANTPAGEIATIRRTMYDARISVARQICNHLIAQQTETLDLKAWAEQVEIDVESLNPEAEGISIHDLMRIEIQRRYGNPGWVTETLGRDALPINLDKEIAMMMGLKLYLDWERFQLARLMSLASGAMVASDAANDYYQGGTIGASGGTSLINSGRR